MKTQALLHIPAVNQRNLALTGPPATGHGHRGVLIKWPALLLALFCILLSSGCGRVVERIGDAVKSRKDATYETIPEVYEEDYEAEYVKEQALGDAPAPKRTATAAAEAVPEQQAPVETQQTFKTPIVDRKRVYSGFLRLSVDSVEKRKEDVFDIAVAFGGYIEQAAENLVIVRLPAGVFEEAMSRLSGIGEVIERSVETQDVTEEYQDLRMRLRISRHARERLYRLLERSDDVQERLRILREIRRLTDEIEEIQQRLDLLEKLVSYSRITVELVPRLAYESSFREMIPFAWIRDLDPVQVSIDTLVKRTSLELPGSYAVFAKEDAFRAESAEGVRVRLGTVQNVPSGDSLFWQQALAYHLEPFYAETDARTLGGAECVLFTSKDREPFFYLVGVMAVRKQLLVTEVFFPTEESLEKAYEDIKEAMTALDL